MAPDDANQRPPSDRSTSWSHPAIERTGADLVRPIAGVRQPTGVRNVVASGVAAILLYEVLTQTVNRVLDEPVLPDARELLARAGERQRREVQKIERSPVARAAGVLSLGFVAGVLMRRGGRARS